jgi:EmrB/QacA subfamily drug resistance transporter
MADIAASAQANSAGFTSKKRTIALVIVALAFVMDLLDSTIVNIAIPSIKANLGITYSGIQWVVAGYSLAFALLLVTGGRMGDVFGYKKLFMFGIAGFTLASLLSGVSQDPTMLIVARILQGSMAAMMVPQVISLMQVMYKPEERAGINGLFGALGGLSASLGPIIGGLLIKANVFGLDWRPIFLINIPIGIFGFFAALKYLPDGKSEHPLKLDIIGTLIIIVAMFLLVFPLIQGRSLNWPTWSIIMIIASLPVFAIFAWWQVKKDKIDGSPLVLPALFKNIGFTIGLSINFIFEMAMIGFFLTFGLVLQIGLGYSPIHAALTGIPVAFGIAFTMAVLGKKIAPKLGRYSISIGTVVMSLGLILTTFVFHHNSLATHSWQLVPGLLMVGIGMGLVFVALFAAVLNGVDTKHAGSASGTLNAFQQVGGAIGVAIIGIIFFGQLGHNANTSFSQIEPAIRTQLSAQHLPKQEVNAVLTSSEKCFSDRTKEQDTSATPISCKSQSSSTKEVGQIIEKQSLNANSHNFTTAFKFSMIFAVAVLILTFIISFLLPAKFKSTAYENV